MNVRVFLFGCVLCVLLVAVGCTTTGAGSAKEDEETLLGMSDVYVANVNSNDVDQYMTVWSEDGIQMPPDAPAVYGKTKIREAMIPIFENFETKMSISTEEVEVVGDLGYSRGTYTFDLTPKAGGEPVHVDGKFLTIYRKQTDGSWLILRDCFNSNVPPG